VITQNDSTIFSGHFVVTNTSIVEFYEDGNKTNILAPTGSYGGNNNVFGSITSPFSDNGVNITTMSYYLGNYGENVDDRTYNLYSFSEKNGFISNFSGVYHFTIAIRNLVVPIPVAPIPVDPIPIDPIPSHPVAPIQLVALTDPIPPVHLYKILITIRLETNIIFNGFFVVDNYVYPNIIGFYEDVDETENILAPVGSYGGESYGGNNNVFNTLTFPFDYRGVDITSMSYYAGNYGSNNNPPPNGDGTYHLYNFVIGIGNISNFSDSSYTFTTALANPADPIPLYPPAPRPLPPIPPPVPPPIDNPVTYIVCQPCQKSRFCYNYKPPGIIEPCCKPIICATDALIASLSALPEVVNNSSRTTESSLLQATVRKQQLCNLTKTTNSTIQSTIANAAAINENIFSQLIDIRNQRYAPYQPYVYPVVPPSVMELQMRTANVGVPHTVNTIANCRGSQFVTT
jgi:hypothetical protein